MTRRQLRITVLIAVATGVLCSTARAQPPASAPSSTKIDDTDALLAGLRVPGGLTADGAAARARGASPVTAEAHAASEAAEARRGLASLGWMPRVRLTAQYTRLSDVDQPALGGLEVPVLLNQWQNRATLEIPLSDYLLRTPHQVAAARHAAESARHGERATDRTVEADARVAYFEWARARLRVVTAERSLALVDESLATAASQERAGTASRADLLRLESRRADAELTLRRSSDAAVRGEDRLRALIGAADGERLTMGEDLARVDPGALAAVRAAAPAEAWRKAAGHRPELLALSSAERAAREEAKVARADLFPRLSGFGEVAYDDPSSRIFPAEDELTMTWSAGLRVSWDFNLALGAPRAREEAEARARIQRARAGQESLRLRDEVLYARQAVDQAEVAIEVGRRGLSAAEESHRVRRALQDAGRATAVEVIDAETELTRARVALVDAHIDLRVALVRWKLAVGE